MNSSDDDLPQKYFDHVGNLTTEYWELVKKPDELLKEIAQTI